MNKIKIILSAAIPLIGLDTHTHSVKQGVLQKIINTISSVMPSMRYEQDARRDLTSNTRAQKCFLAAGTIIAANNTRLIAGAIKNMLLPQGRYYTGAHLAYECMPLIMSEIMLYSIFLLSTLPQEFASKNAVNAKPNSYKHNHYWKMLGNAGNKISSIAYGALLTSMAIWGISKAITPFKQS